MKLLPNNVKVGGVVYKVVFPYNFDEDQNLTGIHISQTSEIKISYKYKGDDRPLQSIYETFIHELAHAIDAVYCGDSFSEEEISKVASGLYQVLLENRLYIDTPNKLPNSVKICGKKYKIVSYVYKDKENVVTTIKPDALQIRLGVEQYGNNFSNSYKKVNLIVAIFFAIFDIFEVRQDSDNINDIVQPFSNGWYQVILDNKLEKLIYNKYV